MEIAGLRWCAEALTYRELMFHCRRWLSVEVEPPFCRRRVFIDAPLQLFLAVMFNEFDAEDFFGSAIYLDLAIEAVGIP